MKKSVEKFAGGKHKKVEQALGLSLRNLFEQLAWRTSPAAVRMLFATSFSLFFRKVISLPILFRDSFSGVLF